MHSTEVAFALYTQPSQDIFRDTLSQIFFVFLVSAAVKVKSNIFIVKQLG